MLASIISDTYLTAEDVIEKLTATFAIIIFIIAVVFMIVITYMVLSRDDSTSSKPSKKNPEADALRDAAEKSFMMDMMAMEADEKMQDYASYYSNYEKEEGDYENEDEDEDEDENTPDYDYDYEADYEVVEED